MQAVIDASALVGALMEGAHATGLAGVASAADALLAPEWFQCEVAAALWKYARAGELTTEDAVARLEDAVRYPIELTPSAELLPEALRIACELPHPLYDCQYLVLALQGGRTLVTADVRMRGVAERLGIRVAWVGDSVP